MKKENFYSRILDVMKKANKFTVNEEVLEINKKNEKYIEVNFIKILDFKI
jgi:hypothetical protein